MNLIDRIKSAIVQRLTLTSPHGWHSDNQYSETGELVTSQSALGLSAVWACVNLVAGTSASLPFQVYKQGPRGERVRYNDHRLYRLLHDSPNYDQTAMDFWEFMFASLELWGNAYAHIHRGDGGIYALVPIAPDAISVRRLAEGPIEYSWSHEGRSYIERDDNVLHIRGFGGNPLGGLSTLQFARNTFGLARATEKSASKMFKNGMRPSGVLSFEKWLSKENREIARNDLAKQFVGAENTGKPLILEGGTTWQALNINPEDAQLLESRSFSVEEVCRFFGVPPFMVGHTEKSTSWGTGLQEQTLGFQKFALRRRLKRVEQAVQKQLLTPSDRAQGITVEFNLEGLLRGDSTQRAEFYQTMTQIGGMTINEVRRLEGLPPVAGGDIPRMQMQNIPIGQNDTNPLEVSNGNAN